MERNDQINVLLVDENQDGTVGGSHQCLLYLLSALEGTPYRPHVLFYQRNRLLSEFEAKAPTFVFRRPIAVRPWRDSYWGAFLAVVVKFYNYLATSLVPFLYFVFFLLRHRIDLVHINNSVEGGWEWLAAARLLGRRCIVHQRGFPAGFNYRMRYMGNRFDRVICVSRAIQDALRQGGIISNTLVSHDALDIERFRARVSRPAQQVRDEWGIPHDAPLLVMTGNFIEWKGQHVVVEAMQRLVGDVPSARLLLVGDSSTILGNGRSYYDQVVELIESSGLREHVIITGYRADVPDLMAAADVLVHASTRPEPFGMVVVEGMALGKPVVATDMGGPAEIIEHGRSGLLVPPGEPRVLAEQLSRLLTDEWLRRHIGQGAFDRVQEAFGLARMRSDIGAVYNDALAPRGSATLKPAANDQR